MGMMLSIWTLFLCFSVGASLLSTCSATVAEGRTLISIAQQWKNATFPSWTAGGDPCVQMWENVSCNSDGFVTYLNVSNRGIIGSLPTQIGDLVHLEELDIGNYGGDRGRNTTIFPYRNNFSGEFPASLANLTSLRVLNTSSFYNVKFPEVVTKLANLVEFQMAETNMTGSIPADLFKLPKLRALYIGGNQLWANLKDFTALTTLRELAFWGSSLNQTIPPEIANLKQLTYLNLHDADLYGPLPEEIGDMMNLNSLVLYSNTLTGRVPDSWKKLTNLNNLRLDLLYLSGLFPTWLLTDLPYLQSLYLTDNQFYGEMPGANLFSKFDTLRVDCNYMNGSNPYPTNPPIKYRTRYNCFTGATNADLGKVVTQCHASHSNLDCPTFYGYVNKGKCPPCPQVQFHVRGNSAANPCVCGYGGGPKSRHGGVPISAVLGGAIALFVVFLLVVGIILWQRREHFSFLDKFIHKEKIDHGDWEVPPGVQRFSTQELSRITENFSDSHVIGVGGFGKVFYGILDDGRRVAIKRASATSMQGVGEFRNEIKLLSRLHHRHLVRLEGFCEEEELQILVYEFMNNGNLHSHLLGKVTSTPLHWYKRLEIAVGVAQGLEYLHSFADPPVIHRDVKPSNILLDENMVAKLADFGISKATAEFDTHVSTRPAGTAGYLDPEYFLRRQLTTASDVYAFGVVLLELITGQEAIDHKREEEYNLIEWTRKRFTGKGLASIIDPLMEYEYSKDAYTTMTELALKCTLFNKDERPSMKVVLATLEPHLAIQSLYSPHIGTIDKESGDRTRQPPERSGKPHRGVHITFESEYLDTSVPSTAGITADNLSPR